MYDLDRPLQASSLRYSWSFYAHKWLFITSVHYNNPWVTQGSINLGIVHGKKEEEKRKEEKRKSQPTFLRSHYTDVRNLHYINLNKRFKWIVIYNRSYLLLFIFIFISANFNWSQWELDPIKSVFVCSLSLSYLNMSWTAKNWT